jgi:hypothetical protein
MVAWGTWVILGCELADYSSKDGFIYVRNKETPHVLSDYQHSQSDDELSGMNSVTDGNYYNISETKP